MMLHEEDMVKKKQIYITFGCSKNLGLTIFDLMPQLYDEHCCHKKNYYHHEMSLIENDIKNS